MSGICCSSKTKPEKALVAADLKSIDTRHFWWKADWPLSGFKMA
jgi:hypothetical protein